MVRKAIIDAATQENIETTLNEVLKVVAAGDLFMAVTIPRASLKHDEQTA